MKNRIVITASVATALLSLSLTATQANAQAYPVKPIRISTSAPAGPYDIVLRGISPTLQQSLGQSLVIENRTGANYVPLGEGCARATPDGYNLCTGDVYTTVLNVQAYSKLPYGAKDFTPIIHFGYLYSALIVHPSVPANNLRELLALARAKPDAINFGTPGPATNSSMYVDYWKKTNVASFQNIAYKSFVQSLNAVVSGEVQVAIFGLGQAMNQARAGKVKALAIIGEGPSKLAPGVPTFREAGVDLTILNWGGLLGPTGLPRDIVMRWNSEMKKVLADTALREKFVEGQGFEQAPPSGGSPEDFAAFLQAEHTKLAGIVKITGLRLD
jgi:tripartite-type tricarboxylate transporter receptor subunit TctC